MPCQKAVHYPDDLERQTSVVSIGVLILNRVVLCSVFAFLYSWYRHRPVPSTPHWGSVPLWLDVRYDEYSNTIGWEELKYLKSVKRVATALIWIGVGRLRAMNWLNSHTCLMKASCTSMNDTSASGGTISLIILSIYFWWVKLKRRWVVLLWLFVPWGGWVLCPWEIASRREMRWWNGWELSLW